ncbi:GntR family transcriptional regulator [Dankookia rubra]|nr:GntR family transcriptional regulator [Dankookia rubra]
MDGAVGTTDSRRSLARGLAAQILDWARREGLPPGAHLREEALAEAFGVSRTPVRNALGVLAADGVVERQSRRGYFLKAMPSAVPSSEDETAGDDTLYFRIADDHLTNLIGPRVAETDLLRRYGMSRAQLGRILARMVHEGWIERRAGQGWEFRPLLRSPEAYMQGFRFRVLVEPAALLEPGYQLKPAVIERLRAEQHALLNGGWQASSRAETHRIGAEFHEALMAGSGNPFMLDALRRVNAMRRLIEYRVHPDRVRLERICMEHLHILDLIESGDLEAASAFLRVHLQGSRLTKEKVVRSSLEVGKADAISVPGSR